MKKFYLIILFAFLASFGSYITAAEKTITYTFTTKDWNATDQEGNAANWVSGGSASNPLETDGIPVYKAQKGANATSPISFNNIKKVKLICGTTKYGAGDIVLTVGGTQTSKTVIKNQKNQSYEVTFDTPVNGYVKFTVNCTTSTIFIKSVAVTYEEEAAADQVAAPTADLEPGTYNVARTVTLTSPDGTTINGFLNDETAIVSTSNTYSKELIAVGGEKTTYTFEVWTEYNKNSSEIVTYKYIIDPSYVPDSYILCTDIKYLTPGTNVIFVGYNANTKEYKVMTDFNTDKNYRNADGTNVVVSGNTLDNIGNAVVFTVAYDGSATDNYKYSFYDSESNYLGSGTKEKNTMSNQTVEGGIIPYKAKWSISLNAGKNYNATIEAKEYFTDNDKIDYPFLRYNSGSPRFACYRSKFAAGLLRIYFNAKTSGVEKVSLTDKKAKVYGANGNIVVEAEAAADVNVYNAAGMLVATQKVGAGRTNIALAKGFYVVRAGNTVAKVAVR